MWSLKLQSRYFTVMEDRKMPTPDNKSLPRLVTCKMLQEILACGESSVRRIRKNKSLNFPESVLNFGRPRFRLSDIEYWIEEQARLSAESLKAEKEAA
jgi:hypothetical protein